MLFHLRIVGIDLCSDACLSAFLSYRQAIGCLLRSEVDEEKFCARYGLLGVEIQLVQHVIDAISTKRDAHSRQPRHTEDSCQVVVSSASRNAAYLHVEGLDLKDGSGVIVQSSCKGQIQLQLVVQAAVRGVQSSYGAQNEAHLLNAGLSRL